MRNIQKLNLDNFKARYESTSHEYQEMLTEHEYMYVQFPLW